MIEAEERPVFDLKGAAFAETSAHSEKPPEIRNKVAAVFGKAVVRLELFARQRWEGWIAWGDQVPAASQRSIDSFAKTVGVAHSALN